MKTNIIRMTAAVLVCAIAGTAAAQTSSPVAAKSQADASRAQSAFDTYAAGSRMSGAPVELLAQSSASGLPRSAKNATAIRSLLVTRRSTDEQVVLIRLLGRQFAAGDPTGQNHLIAADLKALAGSDDVGIARAATFAYSRMGYTADHLSLLLRARQRGILDDDNYFGELAHTLPYATRADQQVIARSLRDSRNDHANQIVAMLVNDAAVRQRISPEAEAELGQALSGTEPRFAMALGQFDLVDAARFSAWLQALATLQPQSDSRAQKAFILAKLQSPSTDPRKVMAFLASEHGAAFISGTADRTALRALVTRITEYAAQHPWNTDMRETVRLVQDRLSS